MAKRQSTMPSFTGELVEELRRFVRNNHKSPAIEGPRELQDALDNLSILLLRNAGYRGRKASKAARANKEWYPEDVLATDQVS